MVKKTPTQERNIDMTDDNIVGIASEGGDGDEGGQVAEEAVGEGVGEDIDGAISENVGQVAEEAVGEVIGESFGEDVGQFAEELAAESDTVLNEDSFRSFKTDDSDLEDNTDHVEAFSCDVNNPIMEVGAKYPNVASFRDALTHFALLNEFELQDSLVKILQGEHACTSANRCRNKVAAQSWLCNRVIEWLRLEGELSTSELRKRLQQKNHCDYLTNNISESFNAWISNDRHKPLIDILDTIWQKIMLKMEERRNRARKWDHEIIPTVLKYVNNISKGLGQYEVLWSDEFSAEVIGPLSRFEVRLHDIQCSCRIWQVKVAKYKEAYAASIAPLPSCDQWVKIDIGHRVLPPILNRPVGRPRNKRIRASDEMAIRKRHRCKRCNQLGHRAKTCKNPVNANQQPTGPSQAANQQPTGPPQAGNQHSEAPIQAGNQHHEAPSQAGNPHSEPPSQASISSGTRYYADQQCSLLIYFICYNSNYIKTASVEERGLYRDQDVIDEARNLQSQQGSAISEIDALGCLENQDLV
uniref:CCHC-type domain-containing protein n=1 Tax=Ananas comosus var. bracteatus TaxID=296719 RepID=A0A6V7NFD3_ANACO|nr:unnamed protein product [Ananas comosus var. bracteatus]